mmetsp:Transcript_52902/g.119645  ORF Transcript_52902/g.119645 Transcript_52902/m.119645 type:complete len:400 (-) Transcript_52902:7-1206(-)
MIVTVGAGTDVIGRLQVGDEVRHGAAGVLWRNHGGHVLHRRFRPSEVGPLCGEEQVHTIALSGPSPNLPERETGVVGAIEGVPAEGTLEVAPVVSAGEEGHLHALDVGDAAGAKEGNISANLHFPPGVLNRRLDEDLCRAVHKVDRHWHFVLWRCAQVVVRCFLGMSISEEAASCKDEVRGLPLKHQVVQERVETVKAAPQVAHDKDAARRPCWGWLFPPPWRPLGLVIVLHLPHLRGSLLPGLLHLRLLSSSPGLLRNRLYLCLLSSSHIVSGCRRRGRTCRWWRRRRATCRGRRQRNRGQWRPRIRGQCRVRQRRNRGQRRGWCRWLNPGLSRQPPPLGFGRCQFPWRCCRGLRLDFWDAVTTLRPDGRLGGLPLGNGARSPLRSHPAPAPDRASPA